MLSAAKRVYKKYIGSNSFEENIVLISVVSIFLPYVISAFVIAATAIRAVFIKGIREKIFGYFEAKLLLVFAVLNIATPFVFKNYIGAGCFVGLCIILVYGLYIRSIITQSLFQKAADAIAFMSIVAAFASTFIKDPSHDMRSPSFFFNPNYYGAAIAFVVILTVYRLVTGGSNRIFLFIALIANLYGLLQSDSQSAMFSIVFGVCLMLFFLKKYKVLAAVAVAAVLVICLLPVMGFVLPRIDEAGNNLSIRATIWNAGINGFLETPIFGRGLMGYMQIFEKFSGSPNFHCHNLFIDMLLSFGILGVIPLVIYVAYPLVAARKSEYSPLVYSMLGAVLLHSLTDVTLIWIQTGALAVLFLSICYIRRNDCD